MSLSVLIVSLVIERLGNGSTGRVTFGGDFERFDGDIRSVFLVGTDNRLERSGGTVNIIDCVIFYAIDSRYARQINCDKCTLAREASEKKEKKDYNRIKLKLDVVFNTCQYDMYNHNAK